MNLFKYIIFLILFLVSMLISSISSAGEVICEFDSGTIPLSPHTQEKVDITVNIKYSNHGLLDKSFPLDVTISLRDGTGNLYLPYSTINTINSKIYSSDEGKWISFTFKDILLADYSDLGNVELYAHVKIDDTYLDDSEADTYIRVIDIFPLISGHVADWAAKPVPDVTVKTSDNYYSVSTNQDGFYYLQVPWGLSGSITGIKSNWSFSTKSYNYLKANQSSQNIIGTPSNITISGYIQNSNNDGIPSVLVDANNGGGSDYTDSSGYYALTVPFGWEGRIIPSRDVWKFAPTSKYYYETETHWDIEDQDYIGKKPPTTPSNLIASDGEYNDKIILTWSNSEYEDGYRIYRSSTENGIYTMINSVPPNTLEYIDYCDAGKTYWYFIIAYNSDDTADSNKDRGNTQTTDTIPPDTLIIEGPTGTINIGDITFFYEGSDNISSKSSLIYAYKLDGYESNWSNFTSLTSKSYSNLDDGTYTFYVKAQDEASNIDPSPYSMSFIVKQNTVAGGEKWHLTIENGGIWCLSFAVDIDGTIYAGKGNDKLYAINHNGSIKWSFPISIFSSPLIDIAGNIFVGSEDNNIYAINPDGTLKWKFATGDIIYSSPSIDSEGTIYIGSEDNNIYAIKADGTLKWKFATGDAVVSSPAIGKNEIIYVGSVDGNVYAINSDGTLKWKFTTEDSIYSCPAIGEDGTLYIGSNDGNVYAINSDGTLKWKFITGGGVYSSPSINLNGTIYVGSLDCNLYAIDSEGSLKWKFLTGGYVQSSPAIDKNGTVYVGSNDKNFYAIQPDGSLKWKFITRDSIFSSPTISADGTLYIGSSDDNFYAIEGDSEGLADSVWPKFHRDLQNSGRLLDNCPDDPNKIEPEICGCGVSDIDTDRDGRMNCVDMDDDNDGLSDNIESTLGTNPIDNDTDNDKIPDAWEVNNDLDPLVNDAKKDKDGDGFSNYREYRAGTDPQNSESHPSKALPWLPLLLGD